MGSKLTLTDLGILLILIGFGTAFVGVLLSILSTQRARDKQIKAGGFVMIGPIPIVFGSDRKWIGLAAILVMAFLFFVFILKGGVGL
jgi:uncharacterized protein (TIGR00304 family)